MKDEDTKVKDARAAFEKAKANFEMVFKNITGMDTDGYCEKIAEFMAISFKDVEVFD